MDSRKDIPVVIQNATKELLLIEQWLSSDFRSQPPENSLQAAQQTPTPQVLAELKAVLDRVRPLLWVYLNRKGAAGAGKPERASAASASRHG